jgi:mycothiol synthase
MSSDIKTEEFIQVAGAPDIAGLRFRNFRGDEDYPAMLEVNNSSKVADDMGHDLHTLDTLRYVYGTTPNHDPLRDVLIAEVQGKMVAFSRVFWYAEIEGRRVYTHYGFVVPEWRGKGLGRRMMQWVEDRAREIDATQSEQLPALVATSVYSSQPGIENLLRQSNYEPVRYEFHMQTEDLEHIPDAPMPDGLEVRPALPEHYYAIWHASAEAFQDHWGATPIDEHEFEDMMKDPRNDPSLWMVAWDGDQVAGSILNFINHDFNERTGRKLGYTESISVRRPWRRKGLARALLARSMEMFKNNGFTQTALGVDTQNPSGALQLYESMGYKVISQSTVFHKPL